MNEKAVFPIAGYPFETETWLPIKIISFTPEYSFL